MVNRWGCATEEPQLLTGGRGRLIALEKYGSIVRVIVGFNGSFPFREFDGFLFCELCQVLRACAFTHCSPSDFFRILFVVIFLEARRFEGLTSKKF